MNKGMKFGCILLGIYVFLVILSYVILTTSHSAISVMFLEISYFPFGIIISNYLAYVLNAILYFLVGYIIGFLLEKKK